MIFQVFLRIIGGLNMIRGLFIFLVFICKPWPNVAIRNWSGSCANRFAIKTASPNRLQLERGPPKPQTESSGVTWRFPTEMEKCWLIICRCRATRTESRGLNSEKPKSNRRTLYGSTQKNKSQIVNLLWKDSVVNKFFRLTIWKYVFVRI